MSKTDSTTKHAPGGTSGADCSTFGYETVTYRFDENTPSIVLNSVELGLTEDVLAWLEMVCAKARWMRHCRQHPGIVSKSNAGGEGRL